MTALTLTTAVANAQKVYDKPQEFCLNRDFQVDPDLSHRATIEELRERMKSLPENEGAIKKFRLKAILGLLYHAPKFEGREEKPKKPDSKPFTNFIKQAAAMSKVSVASVAAPASSTAVVKVAAKPAPAQKGIAFCNQINGNFDLMPTVLKKLIAEYTGDFESDDRFNFGECYPDLCYNELVEEISLKEKLSMEELLQLCGTLKDLYLDSSKENLEGNYEIVLGHCKNLKEFWIKGEITDELYKVLASLPPNIVICFNKNLSDDELTKFAKNFPGLYGIQLKCCRISDVGVKALAENCKGLQVVKLEHCDVTDKGLELLITNCKQLHSVSLLFCYKIGDEGCKALIKIGKQLKELELSCTATMAVSLHDAFSGKTETTRPISGETLHELLQSCEGLERLSLVSVNGGDAFWKMMAITHCKRLKVLAITRCEHVSLSVYAPIAENCKELQELHIDNCDQVTMSSLHTLSKCKGLRVLSLLNCRCLSGSDLEYGLANWKNLQKLIVKNAYVTRAGIDKLMKMLPNLKEVLF